MDKAALLAARKRGREKKVELEEGKSITIVRPPEAEMGDLLSGDGDKRTWSIDIDHVRKYTVGWEGITEADFLDPSVGSSDPVPFDADLWQDLINDNAAWMRKTTDAILEAIVEHIKQKDVVAKNSEPA